MPICGPNPTHDTAEWQALHHAACTPAIDASLRKLYAQLDAAIAEHSPTCWQSGKCCNFDAFDHLLYVTALEACWFTQRAPTAPEPEPAGVNPRAESRMALPMLNASDQPACPYQVNKACTTHTIRPLGCRIFFCQRGTDAWQQDLYESFLQRLQQLHTDHGLPYRYLEWRAALDLAHAQPRTPSA